MSAQNSQVTERSPQNTEEIQKRKAELALRPALDIYEDGDGISLEADMPGVPKDGLHVDVDGENLILEGHIHFEIPEGAQAVYADVRSTLYRCSFVLSRELDIGQIRANLKDGVLQVRIPKRAESKPRRIAIES
jgi:HSP20 family protein